MENWNRLMRAVADAGGIGTPALARTYGVSEATWHRRNGAEGWGRPYRSVRVAPWAPPGRLTDLRAALAACNGHGVAAATTAMWLGGVGAEPQVLHVVIPHGASVSVRSGPRLRVNRARWLTDDDIVQSQGVARLDWPATVVSLAGFPRTGLRGLLIDIMQAGRVTADDCLARLATVGPVRGRGVLEEVLGELGGRRPESWFHDLVLTDLEQRGYPVGHEPLKIATPDGRGLLLDIPLEPFRVAVEPEGDRYHRGASPRRNDRRRRGQAAGTDWRLVPVDWKDWHQRRPWVLATIDAAILERWRSGIGTRRDLPPHLRKVDRDAG